MPQINCRQSTLRLEQAFKLAAMWIFLTILMFQTKAYADWKTELGSLRIGVVVDQDIAASNARLEPFRLAVQEGLDVKVEIFPARDLASLIQAQASGRIEYAVFSASGFAATWLTCECVEPLVVASSNDGTTAIRSIIIIRNNSKIGNTSDLVGKKILALGKDSIAGYAFAVRQMQSEGIAILPDNTQFQFAESAEEAVQLFKEGEADALIGWSSLSGDAATGYSRGTLSQLLSGRDAKAADYQVIWRSQPISHRVHAIKKTLPAEAKNALKALLVSMYEEDPFAYDAIEPIYGGGFKITSEAELQPMINFAKAPLPLTKMDGNIDGAAKPEPQSQYQLNKTSAVK